MKFDLTKTNLNTDHLTLWKQLVSKLTTYEDINSVNLFTDGNKVGIKVKFSSSNKEYTYRGKDAIVNLLKEEDKNYWKNLLF